MSLPVFEHKTFTYEHLNSSPVNEILIQDFSIKNPAGQNLARFLKELAPHNESTNADRTYLIKDKVTKEIVGFFALRNGLFGFTRLAEEDERFVYDRIKPAYDEDCIFMYQIL